MTRIVLLIFAGLTAGAGMLTYSGFGHETSDTYRSIRAGSAGNAAGFHAK